MSKRIILSLCIFSSLNTLNAAENLSTMFSKGKVEGGIRAYSISRSVEDTRVTKDDYTRKANAVGGYLKYVTAPYQGLSFGAAFYTTNGLFLDDDETDYKKVDPTLLGKDNSNYSIFGEAYLKYKYSNTTFKGGRQKLNTPLAGADDVRMTPNLFEAYILTNKDIADTTIVAGHIIKFAQGSFGRAYDGGILAATGGYSVVDTRNQVGNFINMGTYAVGESTSGVSILSATYTGIKGLKVQLWDYYAYDILNAIYADASYSIKLDTLKPFVAMQFISESDVGDKILGDLSGFYWGVKAGVSIENFTTYVAYSSTSENDANDNVSTNAIISPWGGMPAYTQGMVTRHVFLAGTKATKIALAYNFRAMGPNLKTVLYYANYSMAQYNGYTEDDAKEAGFDIIYYPELVKNLQLRLRGNFANDFYVKTSSTDASLNGSVGWNEYRFIMNYKF